MSRSPSYDIRLVKDGDPFPALCRPYTFRTATLAAELAGRGHRVTWYSSTHLHNERRLFSEGDFIEEQDEGYRLHLLSAGRYRKAISIQRWLHHARFAIRLYSELRAGHRPDVVVCCIPILEAALACAVYSQQVGCRFVLDILDPWPEVFVTTAPEAVRPLVRTVLKPYFWLASELFQRCSSLVACSDGFLSWAQRVGLRRPEQKAYDRVVYLGAHRLATPTDSTMTTGNDGLRSIYMGAFSRGYDFDPLIRLLEQEANQDRAHTVYFVGQGGDQYRHLRARLEQNPRVKFTGWLKREEAYRLAKSCHFGWLPLRGGYEDFLPNKTFEYPALGLPMASSRGGEAGLLIEQMELGFLYDPTDSQGLFETVGGLSPGCRELATWRNNAAHFFRTVGDAKRCAAIFADHLEDLVREVETSPAGD